MSTISDAITYTAAAGETWDSIAYRVYLEERMASTLIQANPRLGSVVMFEGGEVITAPIVSKVKTPDTLPPWRR